MGTNTILSVTGISNTCRWKLPILLYALNKKNLKFEKQYLGFTILETILSKIKIRLSHDHYYT
jgi:hypothetical protein